MAIIRFFSYKYDVIQQFQVSEIMFSVTFLQACNFWEPPKNGRGLGSVRHPFRPIFGSFQKMDGVCPSSVPSNFWELPKKGRCLSVVRSVLFLGAFKKWTESVHRPFRPIFGSFQKMDGVCPSSVGRCLSVVRSVLFLGASKKWTESVHRPCCLIFGSFQKMEEVYRNCPSSVLSNFWELPKNGRSLSIVRAVLFLGASKKGTVSVCRSCRPIFGSFKKIDGVCPLSVLSNFWEFLKNG